MCVVITLPLAQNYVASETCSSLDCQCTEQQISVADSYSSRRTQANIRVPSFSHVFGHVLMGINYGNINHK